MGSRRDFDRKKVQKMKQFIVAIAGIALGILIGTLLLGYYTPIKAKSDQTLKQLDDLDFSGGRAAIEMYIG